MEEGIQIFNSSTTVLTYHSQNGFTTYIYTRTHSILLQLIHFITAYTENFIILFKSSSFYVFSFCELVLVLFFKYNFFLGCSILAVFLGTVL